jgi:hypothetical protein
MIARVLDVQTSPLISARDEVTHADARISFHVDKGRNGRRGG